MSIPDENLRQQLLALGIDPGRVEERFIRSQGAGGQNVNKVATCVSLYYAPLHLTVKMQDGRTQAGNRNAAWHLLRDKAIALRKAKVAAVRAAQEQKRRQKRQRPGWLKREMVKFKLKRATRKNTRRRPSGDE